MYKAAAINNYKGADVTTASGGRLIVLAYEGTIKFIKQARMGIEAGDIATKCEKLSRAVAILGELSSSLDKEKGGEVAVRLESLYTYMMTRLLEANIESDVDKLNEVLSLLVTLHEGWVEVAGKSRVVPQRSERSGQGLNVSAV